MPFSSHPAAHNSSTSGACLRVGRRLLATLGLAIGLCAAAPDLDHMQSLAVARYGAEAGESVAAWRRMLGEARALDDTEKLSRVNAFFNRRIRFEDDIVIWKQADYWATPMETLGRGAGDCEDFSIAKYISLRLLDIPAEKLRLVYVRARIGAADSTITQAHMVLSFFDTPAAEPLVLDNLISEIRPASRRPDLFPVFSFNNEGLWVGGTSASSADPTTRLSRWRDVLERMRSEGSQ
ncbi:transglutaminase-like cysteine peptidase [Azoarcus sp. L1K30]|uniref:transglutaminase-like cysteine peptidase n=1 Tax=Azoarcus sp. L1K30 TaxID=2820277 RepID=UPI0032C240BC